MLPQSHLDNLKLIKKKCPNLEILEFLLSHDHPDHSLNDNPDTKAILDLLNKPIKTVKSLKEVVINVEEFANCTPSNNLKKMMSNIGWTVTVTMRPKRVWISLDDRIEFEEQSGRDAYDDEYFRREEDGEDEDEEWWVVWLARYNLHRQEISFLGVDSEDSLEDW